MILVVLFQMTQISHALTFLLQNKNPYCLGIDIQQGHDLVVSYLVMGTNDDEVDFKV